ncbi:MAG: F0F1 ATP synthase subunit A [Chloroflexi bacterium]|nr:F0F1 ATP synthase subunit A [Chloroflexota bacterium]
MSRARLGWMALAAVAIALFGFVFLRGPTPDIKIKPETLFSVPWVNFTNTMVTSWVVVILIVVLVFLATRRWELVPRGGQNLIEAIIEGFYNLVVNVAGEKNGRRFFPVVASIFFFVLFANWFSLLPVFNVIGLAKEEVPAEETVVAEEEELRGEFFVMEKFDLGPLPVAWVTLSSPSKLAGETIAKDGPDAVEKVQEARDEGKFVGEILPVLRGVNTDLNTPLALAIASAIFVEFWGVSALGGGRYASKFFNLGGVLRGLRRFNFGMLFAGAIDAFVGFLELTSELVRLVSFTFRLFGNMFAGEVVILMFTFLTPLLLTLPIYGLELFVGVIQAFVFAMLTLVFGVMAVSHGEVHAEHGGEQGHPAEQLQQSDA